MKRWWIGILALTTLAVIGAVLGDTRGATSPYPSITNPGPRGLKALAEFLRETGHTVLRSESHARTRVLAEPVGPLSERDAEELRSFVDQGGRFIFLAGDTRQPVLKEWLSLDARKALSTGSLFEDAADPGSVSVTVRGVPGVQRLRMVTASIVSTQDRSALEIAAVHDLPLGLFIRQGKGEIWIFPNASLAQNARLGADDNLALWERLASGGPIAFDERFFASPSSASLPLGLTAVGAQLLLIALVFSLALGRRFGPARPEAQSRHRSALEYVRSLATLAQRSQLERALLGRARERLEKTASPDDEAIKALCQELERVEKAGASPREYLRLSQAVARVEQQPR
ncbi:MAG: DUF4350 domain-containing protein [Myxococcaceae bacterium]